MSLDTRIKEVTLKITLHHIMRNAHKSIERTCRNVIALGRDLSSDPFTSDMLNQLQVELKQLLYEANEEQIRTWLVLNFHLK